MFTLLGAVLLLFPEAAEAQRVGSAVNPVTPRATLAADPELKRDYSHSPVELQIVLPPIDADIDADVDASAERGSEARRLRIGIRRSMPDSFRGDLAPKLDWADLPDGSVVSALAVTSPGASAMRLGIRAELPEGGEIRFFADPEQPEREGTDFPVIDSGSLHLKGGGSGEALPSVDAADASKGTGHAPAAPDSLSGHAFTLKGGAEADADAELLWSPVVKGDTLGVEVTLPSRDAQSGISLTIEKVSHIHTAPGDSFLEPRRLDCFSHVDVACAQSRFPRGQADAVASILFEDEEGTYLCSGTLLNDTVDGSFIPYFLTAHHCVSNEEEAASVEAWWFFQRETCGRVKIDGRYTVTYGGADVLASDADYDSTLLRLAERPPDGVTFSGWSADPIRHPTQVHSLHHPDGEVMKFSSGSTVRQRNILVGGLGTVYNAIVVRWSRGATERGSSGSGLFDDTALVGVLSGGTDLCVGGLDVYGPFRNFLPEVNRWLDPEFAYSVPLVMPASHPSLQGFVRIVNHSLRPGTVRIEAIDDEGARRGPVSVSLALGEAVHFNSGDLENGNPAKGLFPGVGQGAGNWRLELTSALELEVLAYIRSADGFLTSIHEVAAELGSDVRAEDGGGIGQSGEEQALRYHVPIFNPGGNESQVSWLRLINPGDEAVEVAIEARDDDGDAAPWGEVRLTLAAGAARSLSSWQLEQGDAELRGRFGIGTGKWRLSVSADGPIRVMSLLQSPTGHISNLSR